MHLHRGRSTGFDRLTCVEFGAVKTAVFLGCAFWFPSGEFPPWRRGLPSFSRGVLEVVSPAGGRAPFDEIRANVL